MQFLKNNEGEAQLFTIHLVCFDMIDHEKKLFDIIESVKNGETQRFAEIIENYKKLVLKIAYRMIPREAEIEDICQDIFLKIYKNLSRFRGECKFSTWVARISYHHCINFLRKRKLELFNDESQFSNQVPDHLAEPTSQQRHVEIRDIGQRLDVEIAKLAAPHRAALLFFHVEGMHYDEIAAVMEVPVNTAKSYLFRARKSLRAALEQRYSKEEILL